MAGYDVRTLAELSDQAKGFLTQSITGTVTKVWANTYRVFGKVLALAGQELELRRAWLVRQLFASTADEIWLRRHGFELGLTQAPAMTATGTMTAAATSGTVVPAGLQYARDDGVTFTTLASATASGNSVTLMLEADVAAAAGNTDAGTVLTLVDTDDAPAGLDGTGTVSADGFSGGLDLEPLETFRGRVLARKRKLPQGGSGPDYESWVREALGSIVGSVFVDSFQNDARSVWVAFTVLNLPAGVDRSDPDAVLTAIRADPTIIIPTPGQVAIAQAYIDDPIRRPVTARAFAVAPVPSPVDIMIGGLAPDTVDIRTSIATELAATFIDRSEPGRPSLASSLSASWLDEAISRATGEDRHRLVSPATDLTFTAGFLPVLGAIGYTN